MALRASSVLGLRLDLPLGGALPGTLLLASALALLPSTAARGANLDVGPTWLGGHGEALLVYATDHLGSTRAVFDTSGSTVETRDYAPFGRTIAHTGSFALKHRFTGQLYEGNADLHDYGARMYRPRWGRFLSPDERIESLDPQGLHTYAYARNRPTSLTDPDGRTSVSLDAMGRVTGGMTILAGNLLVEAAIALGPENEYALGLLAVGMGVSITGASLTFGLGMAFAVTLLSTSMLWFTLATLLATAWLAVMIYRVVKAPKRLRELEVAVEGSEAQLSSRSAWTTANLLPLRAGGQASPIGANNARSTALTYYNQGIWLGVGGL